jgi:sensor histidine kinase regulating citrate/malate metabolism
MRLAKTFQSLTLSRRIFLIFVGCVLLPLTLFLSLFSFSLADELKDQAFQRMRFQAKTLSVAVIDKLQQLQDELRFFTSNAWDPSRQTFRSPPAISASRRTDTSRH